MSEKLLEMILTFVQNNGNWGTNYNGAGEFYVAARDIPKFTDYLQENFPDLVGIKCYCTESGIWFTYDDVFSAQWY